MAVWSEVVTKAGTSNAADTFEEVGTITTNERTRYVCGVAVAAAKTTTTTAEASAAQVRVTVTGHEPALFICAALQGAQGVTNIAYREEPITFIPLKIECQPNARVKIEYAQFIAATAGNDAAIAVFYSDGLPDDNWYDSFGAGKVPASRGGDAEANTNVSTVAEQAVTALLVPSWATKIVGWQIRLSPDAVATANEGVVAKVVLRANLPDFSPQELVFPAYHASLGTPTEGSGETGRVCTYPTDIPLPAAEVTITPYTSFVVATTGANVASVGVLFE